MQKSRLDFAEIIKERVSTREMMESTGLYIDRRGMVKCPFHADGDASLKIYRDPRRGWHCYGCHAGGDVIDFAMRWYGLGFKDAMARINADFALGLPIGERASPDELRAIREELRRRREMREAKQKALDAAEKAYWAAYDAWLWNETIISAQRPTGAFDAMSEEFIHAVTHSAEIRDSLDMAEERWWRARAG